MSTPATLDEARAFLKSTGSVNGDGNMYDHLKTVIATVLDKRPANALDVLEQLSVDVKRSGIGADKPSTGGLQSPATATSESIDTALAKRRSQLFSATARNAGATGEEEEEEEEAEDEDAAAQVPDLLEQMRHFEWAGLGLGHEETFRLQLSLRQLVKEKPLANVRLFGKVTGLNNDYIIVETEYREGERPESSAANTGISPPAIEHDDDLAEALAKRPFPVQEKTKEPVPVEDATGPNRWVYFVCKHAGDAWVALPDVTPQQIAAAAQLTKLMTGDLDAAIVSYPPFPGVERHFLRAQIARIVAATSISPRGFFGAEGEEEEEEVLEGGDVVPNPEYEALPVDQLANLDNWVHHVPALLQQGRTTWWSAKSEEEGDEAEEEEEEGEEENAKEPEEVPEEAPPILRAVVDDAPVAAGVPGWTSRISTAAGARHATAVARSLRWPGAVAVAWGAQYATLYIGNGQKASIAGYTPPVLPDVAAEPADLDETADPSVEDEKSLEAAMQEAEAEEEEAEAEEEEDDD